jgi:hypothetical protein
MLPPELFIQVFSQVNRPTLAAFCSTFLAFLKLATFFSLGSHTVYYP